jgi:hypothetical protein
LWLVAAGWAAPSVDGKYFASLPVVADTASSIQLLELK